jgi:predicted DNA-binding ribbon-helix-helix protein
LTLAAQASRPDGARGASGVLKRSLAIAGHRTSISLEAAFWTALTSLAALRGQSIASLVAEIDAARGDSNLSSAIRVYVLQESGRAKSAG